MVTKARRLLLLCLLMFGLAAVSPSDATAQRWLQTAQLLTEVRTDGPVRALLDTLVQVIERKDSLKVRRAPDATERMSISDLRNTLISQSGIGLTSANNVFIDYRFEIENRGFEESIDSFQFIYRPPGAAQEDIQMLYIDATEPWVKNILRNKGTTLTSNQAALQTFSDQIAFARMQKNGQIVEIAGQTVRNRRESQKRQLVRKIQRLTYGSM